MECSTNLNLSHKIGTSLGVRIRFQYEDLTSEKRNNQIGEVMVLGAAKMGKLMKTMQLKNY